LIVDRVSRGVVVRVLSILLNIAKNSLSPVDIVVPRCIGIK
jgi:hypothetical protein